MQRNDTEGLGSKEGFSIRSAKAAATCFLSDLLFFHGYLFTLKERKKGIIIYTPGGGMAFHKAGVCCLVKTLEKQLSISLLR